MSPQESPQTYCWNCGAAITEEKANCRHCGSHLEADASEQRESSTANGTNNHRDDTVSYLSLPVLTHVLGMVTWAVGPALVYLVSDDEYTKEHAARAIEWSVTLTCLAVLPVILFYGPVQLASVLSIDFGWGGGLGFVLLLLTVAAYVFFCVVLLHLAFCLVAAHRAANGQVWQYPLTLSLFSR